MNGSPLERLADNTLLLVQELRNNAKREERIAEQLHNATEAMLAVKREVHDSNATQENVLREVHAELRHIREGIAAMVGDVDDAERAAHAAAAEAKATREATGAQVLAAHSGDSRAGMVRAFGALPRFTQVLIVIGFVLLAVSGWLHMIFK